jgi:hypothetical protein
MIKLIAKKTIILSMIMSLLGIGLPQIASAGLIGTQSVVNAQEREDRLQRIDRVLSKDAVQDQMVSMGIDPVDAQARVATLTNEELLQLEQSIDEMPAGGSAVAVVGVVFIVLMVLELVGVTNIFTSF